MPCSSRLLHEHGNKPCPQLRAARRRPQTELPRNFASTARTQETPHAHDAEEHWKWPALPAPPRRHPRHRGGLCEARDRPQGRAAPVESRRRQLRAEGFPVRLAPLGDRSGLASPRARRPLAGAHPYPSLAASRQRRSASFDAMDVSTQPVITAVDSHDVSSAPRPRVPRTLLSLVRPPLAAARTCGALAHPAPSLLPPRSRTTTLRTRPEQRVLPGCGRQRPRSRRCWRGGQGGAAVAVAPAAAPFRRIRRRNGRPERALGVRTAEPAGSRTNVIKRQVDTSTPRAAAGSLNPCPSHAPARRPGGRQRRRAVALHRDRGIAGSQGPRTHEKPQPPQSSDDPAGPASQRPDHADDQSPCS